MFSSKIKNTLALKANAQDYRVWQYLAIAKPRLGFFIIQDRPLFFFFLLFSPIRIKNASYKKVLLIISQPQPFFDCRSGHREDGRPTSSGSSSVSNMTRRLICFNMLAFPGERL